MTQSLDARRAAILLALNAPSIAAYVLGLYVMAVAAGDALWERLRQRLARRLRWQALAEIGRRNLSAVSGQLDRSRPASAMTAA